MSMKGNSSLSRCNLQTTLGNRTPVQADKAKFPAQILLWGKRQRYQDTDLDYSYRKFAADGDAKTPYPQLELFRVGHIGKNRTDLLCRFLQFVQQS